MHSENFHNFNKSDRRAGVLDLALDAGIVIKPSMGWYQKVDPDTGELIEGKYRAKETNTAAFWEDLLKSQKFKDFICKKYQLVMDESIMSDEQGEAYADEE